MRASYSTAGHVLTKRDLGADRLKPWCCLKRPAAQGAKPNKDPHTPGENFHFSVPLDSASKMSAGCYSASEIQLTREKDILTRTQRNKTLCAAA